MSPSPLEKCSPMFSTMKFRLVYLYGSDRFPPHTATCRGLSFVISQVSNRKNIKKSSNLIMKKLQRKGMSRKYQRVKKIEKVKKMKIERRVDAAGPPAKPQAAFLTLPALPNARVSVVLLQWCFPLPVTRLHGLRHIRQTEEVAAQADAEHRSDPP